MIRAVVLLACAMALAGCEGRQRNPDPEHRRECERRGWTEGTPAFRRCVRGLEATMMLDEARPGRDLFVR